MEWKKDSFEEIKFHEKRKVIYSSIIELESCISSTVGVFVLVSVSLGEVPVRGNFKWSFQVRPGALLAVLGAWCLVLGELGQCYNLPRAV